METARAAYRLIISMYSIFCYSKRAKNLVALAQLHDQNERVSTLPHESILSSPFANSPSTASSPALGSPAPLWWDDVFEAADIPKIHQQPCVRRKLFLSPQKAGPEQSATSKRNTSCPPAPSGSDSSSFSRSDSRDTNDDSGRAMEIEDGMPQVSATSWRHSENERALEGVNLLLLPNTISTNLQDSQVPHITSSASLDCATHVDVPVNLNVCSILKSLSANVNKTIYPSHLKILSAKLALNSGEEHTTPRGSVRRDRQIRAQCQESCKRCSHPRLSQEERFQINKGFWELRNHEEQWKFIVKSVIVSAPKKKIASKGSKGEKLTSRTYFLSIDGKERRVCKTTFKNTLCICDSWIDNAISHSSESGMQGDQRGKHKNRPKRSQKVVRAVTEQSLINSK